MDGVLGEWMIDQGHARLAAVLQQRCPEPAAPHTHMSDRSLSGCGGYFGGAGRRHISRNPKRTSAATPTHRLNRSPNHPTHNVGRLPSDLWSATTGWDMIDLNGTTRPQSQHRGFAASRVGGAGRRRALADVGIPVRAPRAPRGRSAGPGEHGALQDNRPAEGLIQLMEMPH